MTTEVVNLKDFAKKLDGFTDDHLETLRLAAISGVAQSIPDLVRASPVDTGLYAQSWDFTEEEGKVILGNYAPHAAIIEYGARPFTPPLAPLLAWAKRVLNDASQPPDYSPRVKSLAFAVQAKIKREGMQPKSVMRNAIPQILENIKNEFKRLV